jgi:hypothetical protein
MGLEIRTIVLRVVAVVIAVVSGNVVVAVVGNIVVAVVGDAVVAVARGAVAQDTLRGWREALGFEAIALVKRREARVCGIGGRSCEDNALGRRIVAGGSRRWALLRSRALSRPRTRRRGDSMLRSSSGNGGVLKSGGGGALFGGQALSGGATCSRGGDGDHVSRGGGAGLRLHTGPAVSA